MKVSNQELETALRRGDEQMFEAMFKEYYGRLCRYAAGILSDTDEAEEVVQQVFLAVWEKRLTIEIKISIRAYLFRAVHNRSLNLIQQVKVRHLYAVNLQLEGIPLSPGASQELSKKELEKEIKKALQQLPEQCRKIFELSRFGELKYSEIANQLEISVKTVENQMGKALRIMREQLKDYLPLIAVISGWINLLN